MQLLALLMQEVAQLIKISVLKPSDVKIICTHECYKLLDRLFDSFHIALHFTTSKNAEKTKKPDNHDDHVSLQHDFLYHGALH